MTDTPFSRRRFLAAGATLWAVGGSRAADDVTQQPDGSADAYYSVHHRQLLLMEPTSDQKNRLDCGNSLLPLSDGHLGDTGSQIFENEGWCRRYGVPKDVTVRRAVRSQPRRQAGMT